MLARDLLLLPQITEELDENDGAHVFWLNEKRISFLVIKMSKGNYTVTGANYRLDRNIKQNINSFVINDKERDEIAFSMAFQT